MATDPYAADELEAGYRIERFADQDEVTAEDILGLYRAFVGGAHRKSNVAVNLAVTGRDVLQQQFGSGEDVRGQGIVYEVENEGLKTHFNQALWLPTGFTFVGVNPRGDHVRVRYFPGALAPERAQ